MGLSVLYGPVEMPQGHGQMQMQFLFLPPANKCLRSMQAHRAVSVQRSHTCQCKTTPAIVYACSWEPMGMQIHRQPAQA